MNATTTKSPPILRVSIKKDKKFVPGITRLSTPVAPPPKANMINRETYGTKNPPANELKNVQFPSDYFTIKYMDYFLAYGSLFFIPAAILWYYIITLPEIFNEVCIFCMSTAFLAFVLMPLGFCFDVFRSM